MNILIFVMTLLLLLASMTYARLETYRNSQIFQVLFERYMQKDERGYINLAAEREYNRAKGSKKEGKESGERVDASPRISIAALVKKGGKESDPQEVKHLTALLRNLINTLYTDQPFFKEIEQKRPAFIDEIISTLMQNIEALPLDKRPKKAADLANIALGDDQLNDVYYKMLHGAPFQIAVESKQDFPTLKNDESSTEEEQDQTDAAIFEKEAEEYKSPKGYYSLLDFVTLDSVKKVRVYLASREVLKAIYYNNPEIVEDIIRERNELYKEAQGKDKEEIKALSELFKNRFSNREDPMVGEALLDFTISKTDPKKYE